MSTELMRLYTWLLGEKIEPHVDFATSVNQPMVNKTLEYIKGKHQSFIREARLKRMGNAQANLSSPAIKSSSSMETEQESLIAATFKTAEDYDHVHNFLSFCSSFLQDKDSASLCVLALSYLVESESLVFPEKQAKVAALFTQFIELDEEQALRLYKNSNFAQNFPATTLLVDVKAVTHAMKRLEGLLCHEMNLMGIVPLFYEKFFDVNELAALILCLLKRGAPARQLIQNRMLHDFLNYHLHALDSPDSAVKQLYAVLGQFSDAHGLIEKASSRVAELQNYRVPLWLNGERSEKPEKLADAIIDTPFTFTITEDNCKNLHTLFGNRFLMAALALFARNQDNALKERLISCINEIESNSLNDFIKTVVEVAKERNAAALLKSLATIINDETINKLLCAGQGVIFHLAPYKPVILNTLEKMDSLQDYISALIKSNNSAYDTIGQLIVLLKQSTKNANVEELLYREILNFVIKNPSIQQEDVIDSLINYTPKYREIIQQQASSLVEELKQSIENNMLSKNDPSKDAYGLVEDTWRASGFSLLKQLNNALHSDYPPDKYALYAYIVNSLVKKPEIKFNLSDFLNNIIRSQNEFAEGDVSEFERALIEILVAVDDPLVRETAIELLETTPRKNKQWIEKEYGGKSIFSLAAKLGNLGLVQFLLTQSSHTISSEAVSIALGEAALNGHADIVKLLLAEEGVEVNKADKDGETPLLLAATNGHAEVVKLLLAKEGVEVNKADKDGETPLLLAAGKGHAKVVKLLLDQEGIDVNKVNKRDKTPLDLAVDNGHAKVVKLLLDQEGIDVNKVDKRGNTLLIAAATNGHTEVVKLLLDQEGIDVNKADKRGYTPLLWAMFYGHPEIVTLLLAKKEVDDVNKANKDGETPLLWAAANGHVEVVKLLLDKEGVEVNKANKNGETPLLWAAANGHAEVVKLLLDKEGVEVNKANNYGETPLLRAAAEGHTEVVKLLLDKEGVEVNKEDKIGNTPLIMAAANGHAEIVKLLLDKEGVEVNKEDKIGKTPLLRAAAKGHAEIVKLLLAKEGVDANKANEYDSYTPLLLAATNGHAEVVTLLLDKEGIEVNKADENGDTPLFWAANKGHPEIVKLLLDKEGIDVNKENKYSGYTPLLAAAYKGLAEIVKLLLSKEGIDVNKANKDRKTPLALAVENGHAEVVKLLLIGKKLPEIIPASLPKLFELVKESPQAIAKAMTILNKMSKEQPQNYSQLQALKQAYNSKLFQCTSKDAAFAKENKALLHASSPEELREMYGNDDHLENLKKYIFGLLQSQNDLNNNPALELIQNYVNFLNDQQLSAALNVFNNNQSQVETTTQVINVQNNEENLINNRNAIGDDEEVTEPSSKSGNEDDQGNVAKWKSRNENETTKHELGKLSEKNPSFFSPLPEVLEDCLKSEQEVEQTIKIVSP